MQTGQRAALFLPPLPAKDLPSDASPDRPLIGRVSLMSNGNGDGPHSVPLVVLPAPTVKEESKKVLCFKLPVYTCGFCGGALLSVGR